MTDRATLVTARTQFSIAFAKRAGCPLTHISAVEAFIAEVLGYARPSSFGNVRLGHRHASEEAVATLRAHLADRRISCRGLNFDCILNPDVNARNSPRSRAKASVRVVRMGVKERRIVVLSPVGAALRVRTTTQGGRVQIEISVQ